MVQYTLTNNERQTERNTMWKIIRQHRVAYDAVYNGADLMDYPEFFQALYDYFVFGGEMPYGVAKARFGDPAEWIMDRSEVWHGPSSSWDACESYEG